MSGRRLLAQGQPRLSFSDVGGIGEGDTSRREPGSSARKNLAVTKATRRASLLVAGGCWLRPAATVIRQRRRIATETRRAASRDRQRGKTSLRLEPWRSRGGPTDARHRSDQLARAGWLRQRGGTRSDRRAARCATFFGTRLALTIRLAARRVSLAACGSPLDGERRRQPNVVRLSVNVKGVSEADVDLVTTAATVIRRRGGIAKETRRAASRDRQRGKTSLRLEP